MIRGTDGYGVTAGERTTVKAPELSQRVGPAAAQHHGHVDPAGEGEVGSGARRREAAGHHVTLPQRYGGPLRHRVTVDTELHDGAGHRHDGRLRDAELRCR